MTSQHPPADTVPPTRPGTPTPPDQGPADHDRRGRGRRDHGLRLILWIALALGVTANLITVITLENPLYSSASGLVVIICALGLGLLARRARRQRKAADR